MTAEYKEQREVDRGADWRVAYAHKKKMQSNLPKEMIKVTPLVRYRHFSLLQFLGSLVNQVHKHHDRLHGR